MDYEIAPIDIDDPAILEQVNALLAETFGHDVPPDKLANNTRTLGEHESLYLAAFHGETIIGFNGFISHDLILNGAPLSAYQSCWTATSAEHRGKRIFQNLINTAKQNLTERGAAFIFGFGNKLSQPLLINKLGFREIPSLKWQQPNAAAVRGFYLNSAGMLDLSNSILQNDEQLIALKSKEYGQDLIAVRRNESVVWGVPRSTKKFGIELRYFEIGGVSVESAEDGELLFQEMTKQTSVFHYFQFTLVAGNTFNKMFKRLKPARTNDLIVFDLDLDTTNIAFNFFGGIKDVY